MTTPRTIQVRAQKIAADVFDVLLANSDLTEPEDLTAAFTALLDVSAFLMATRLKPEGVIEMVKLHHEQLLARAEHMRVIASKAEPVLRALHDAEAAFERIVAAHKNKKAH